MDCRIVRGSSSKKYDGHYSRVIKRAESLQKFIAAYMVTSRHRRKEEDVRVLHPVHYESRVITVDGKGTQDTQRPAQHVPRAIIERGGGPTDMEKVNHDIN